MRKKWTKEEILIVKENFSSKNREWFNINLPLRTYNSIRMQAYKMGLSFDNFKWSDEKIKILKNRYELEGCSDSLAKDIGFTKRAIVHKASRLNIKYKFFKKSGKNNKCYLGYELISGTFWHQIRKSASQRNILFSISIEDAWNQFIKQNKKCSLTGESLFFPINSHKRNSGNISLDRIDAYKPYIKENIQWILKPLNRIKQNLNNEDFIYYCKLVADYNK